jgi:hypothetical protein
MPRPDPEAGEYGHLLNGTLDSMSGKSLGCLPVILGVVAILSSLLTCLLMIGGDYSRATFSPIPIAIGTAICVYGFTAASRLLCLRDAKGILWVVPAVLSPLLWLVLAYLFDVDYRIH